MTRVRRNSKEFKKAFAEAKNVRVYTFDNDFSGIIYPSFVFGKLDSSDRLTKQITEENQTLYTLHVHSNLWYRWLG